MNTYILMGDTDYRRALVSLSAVAIAEIEFDPNRSA